MGAAFVYMYVVGLGTSLGVATSVFIGWKYYKRSESKGIRRKQKGAI